jgi:cysteine desulfurase
MTTNSQDKPPYMDYMATTPCDCDVMAAMEPYFQNRYGNPSSMNHAYGWEADAAVARARTQVSRVIGCEHRDVVWTSGATESNNLALLGSLRPLLRKGHRPHLITTLIEHKAVLDVAKHLEAEGVAVTFLQPDRYGQVSVNQIKEAMTDQTMLVSIMHGNNEIGTLNPISEIGNYLKNTNISLHVDAAQSFGKVAIDVGSMGIDFLSASGHKIYGPKGVGFLYYKTKNRKLDLEPLFFGGSQENGLRPGTLNVPGIVGMGFAAEKALNVMDQDAKRFAGYRKRILASILDICPKAQLNGHPDHRLPNNLNISFCNVDPDDLLDGLMGIAYSSGSACSAGAPSYVLKALGLSDSVARSTVRLSFGRATTEQDIDSLLAKIQNFRRVQ